MALVRPVLQLTLISSIISSTFGLFIQLSCILISRHIIHRHLSSGLPSDSMVFLFAFNRITTFCLCELLLLHTLTLALTLSGFLRLKLLEEHACCSLVPSRHHFDFLWHDFLHPMPLMQQLSRDAQWLVGPHLVGWDSNLQPPLSQPFKIVEQSSAAPKAQTFISHLMFPLGWFYSRLPHVSLLF